MLNKARKLLSISLLSLSLLGCWDYEDINKRSITLSVGIDEKDGKVIFNGEIAKLMSGSSQGVATASVTDVYYYNSEGKSFEEARNDFEYNTPLRDFSGAVRSVVFSKKYAEKEGLESYMNRFSFMPGFRNSVLVTISKISTQDLFKNKVINDIAVGYGVEDTIRYLESDGATLYATAQKIMQCLAFKEIGFVLPYITKEENAIKYLGLAVIKDSKLIGVIDAADTSGVLFLAGKKATLTKALPNPQNETNLLSVKAMLQKRKIKTSYHDDKIHIHIKLDLNSMLQYEYMREPISDAAIKDLEGATAHMVKQEVLSSIKRSQEEFSCDIFGFARYFRSENPEIFKTINWVKEYPNALFSVEVNTKIVNYNLLNTNFKNIYKGGTYQ